MIEKRRALAALLGGALFAGLSRPARAEEVSVGGRPLEIDVTNTSILNHHFDNHNEAPFAPSTRVDDNYNEWIDRFNLQLSYWKFTAAVRLDTYFATQFSPADIAKFVNQDTSDPAKQLVQTQDYEQDLDTRYINTFYPSKLWVGFLTPGIEATAGDFYVQLGRGLVFSVRKIDELSIDTTVRGGKLVLDRQLGPIHVDLLGFAGEMNPIRIDETSGRRLNVLGNDPLFFGFPTGRPWDTTQLNTQGVAITDETAARANYIEDAAFGGKIEVGTKDFQIGVNAAMVRRKSYDKDFLTCIADGHDKTVSGTSTLIQGLCEQQFPSFTQTDPSRSHDTIRNVSGSVNVPSLAGHGDLYVEVAGQQLADGKLTALPDVHGKDTSGYAIYAAASVRGGPVSLSLEGKHYRSFFPIPANIDLSPGTSATEFNNVFYSQPPTTQSIYFPIVSGASPDICVTGGRAVGTYRFNPSASLFTWIGHYTSLTEVNPENFDCASESSQGAHQAPLSNVTNTWDYASGLELFFEHGKTKVSGYVGAIEDDIDGPSTAQGLVTNTFYRETYVRYDIVKHIAGPFSVQAQGWHRHRYEPVSYVPAWYEGENYTALQWSPHFSGIFGFEYLDQAGCQPGDILGPGKVGPKKNFCPFFNGGAQWRARGAGGVAGKLFDTVNVFVGDQRGAIRCVSGVCRAFPPFSGAKLEIVSRF